MGITSGIGTPIIVDGATWGVITAYMIDGEQFPEHAETRLFRFTELVATAISNMQALDDLHDLVHEQTALRRVATLVARETGLEDVMDAVCAAVVELFHPSNVTVIHYPPGMVTQVLRTWTLGQDSEQAEHDGNFNNIRPLENVVRGTLSPSRVVQRDEPTKQLSTVIGAPVVVGNGLWGALLANSDGILPVGSEATLAGLRRDDRNHGHKHAYPCAACCVTGACRCRGRRSTEEGPTQHP